MATRHASHHLPSTVYRLPPTTHHRSPAYVLPTAYRLLPTAHCPLPAHCLQGTLPDGDAFWWREDDTESDGVEVSLTNPEDLAEDNLAEDFAGEAIMEPI